MDCTTPGLPVHHQLPEFTQTHVHWVGDAIQPSHSLSSFFLELVLHWSPAAYWAPADLGSSSFSVLCFCLFILFMEFSRQKYWSDLPFPFPVDHILSELSIMTCPSWVALHNMPHSFISFIELNKAVVHVIRLVSFLWLWFYVLGLTFVFNPFWVYFCI